ncbi:MAG: hypothetical protein ACJA0Q_001522 [Saprospiraceae bacterium]|jgi:hypothetical protein
MKLVSIIFLLSIVFIYSCGIHARENVDNESAVGAKDSVVISKADYTDKLQGFWLGQSIANWTGLITEMDRIGNIGNVKTGKFYTRENWGKPDSVNIWGKLNNGEVTSVIDFILKSPDEIWGSDDDTDMEYMYQELLLKNSTSILSPLQIKEGWMKHIKKEEENYLWVSNQRAFDLMLKGTLPPYTSSPELNPYFDMIDAQLCTEIFGLFSPTRSEFAKEMAYLPIRTVAREEAVLVAEFYVEMHALASSVNQDLSKEDQIKWMARQARYNLPDYSTVAKMYDFVWAKFQSNISWEKTRDSIYVRYQVNQMDGYTMTSRNLNCNGCFASGINFAASLVSLFYGKGDVKETIKIGTLTGWDSDNPTATWGGLLGFMHGKEEVEQVFNQKLSMKYNIHRTRINFPNNGIDDFDSMSKKGLKIIDRVVVNHLKGRIDTVNNNWVIPLVN